MQSVVGHVSGSKSSLLLIVVIVTLTAVDSQFVRFFYTTDLGNPRDLHLILFGSLAIVASSVSILLLKFAKSNDTQARNVRPLSFKLAYVCTVSVQMGISFILFFALAEMLTFHVYNKILSLLVVYLSHLSSAFILGMLSFTFLQWFRSGKSFPILIYGIVFIVILFLILTTLPLLTEQFRLQPQEIYPRSYMSLIQGVLVPSPDIAFIYGLGNYVLPVLVIVSWILTVSLLKVYSGRIGKKKFWLIVSIPLVYQIFMTVVSDPDSVSNLGLVEVVYSTQFQVLVAINGQISGLFFAIAYWIVGRRTGNKSLKNFFLITSLGIISLFSSLQPGSPFYATYPPFGLVTMLFLGLSSYMLLVGMVGSAAYVSRNSKVRREVYKGLEADSHFLQMGMAEMQREVQRRVLTASLEPLLPAWWNWWNAHPPSFNSVGWPQCVKGNTGVLGHNLTVVLLTTGSNLASNVNATHQKCEIGANQLAFLNVYNGECSTGEFPGYSTPDLLKCAQDSNKVITKMQVKVDGMDVSSNVIRQSTSKPFMYIVPPVNAFDFKTPVVGTHPSMAETYYLLFKPLPVGDHTIDLEVIRVPQQPNQPVEHDFGHWDLHVVPST